MQTAVRSICISVDLHQQRWDGCAGKQCAA